MEAPVSLLGGLKKDQLLANVSAHVNKKGEAACVAKVEGSFVTGFRSTKHSHARGDRNIGGDSDPEVSLIRSLKAALEEDAIIWVDIGSGVRWGVDTATAVGNRMAALAIGRYEEPLYPTGYAGYAKLRGNTNVRFATDEREFTQSGYRRQMEFLRAIDVYGVDPARVEGITSFRRVDALCSLDLSRFRSGQVFMLSGLAFEGHGAFPAQGCVSSARVVEAIDVFEEGNFDLPAGLPVSAPEVASVKLV